MLTLDLLEKQVHFLPLNGQKGSKITPWTSYRQSSNLVVARSTRAGDAIFMDDDRVRLIQLLLARLEHISADSIWAHRASGIRGSLFRILEALENGETAPDSKVESLISAGFHILENVLKENFKRNTAV